ncbi:MAG: hypothetical protein AB2L24_19330 [Mangrovibacterium sp.]
MKRFSIFIFLLAAQFLQAQENKLTQEEAEARAFQNYLKNNTMHQVMPAPAPAVDEALFGARLVRSATLLSTSCKDRRWPVRVLIYGQSITGSRSFSEQIGAYLNAKFPYADITLENRSIGGFGGERLIRTAVHDVYYWCPDLIIFHVYGGERHGELEQLFSNIRKYTTADIILMNHHINGDQKSFNFNQASWQYLSYIAAKYNCERVDITKEWIEYLKDNNLEPSVLLRDNVHPNPNGNWLMAQLIGRHIRCNALASSDWYNTVQICYVKSAYDTDDTKPLSFTGAQWEMQKGVPVGTSGKSGLKLTFHGSRVDVIAGQVPDLGKPGRARVLVDGKPVAEHQSLYAITRPGAGPGTWFPAVMRIGHTKPLVEEDWTLTIDRVNADSTVWYFSVKGSKTGYDGSGNTAETFVSRSGRVVIDAGDYMFAEIKKTFKKAAPAGFQSTWSVVPLYVSVYQAPETPDKAKVYKTTLVQGLSNDWHTLELVPLGDGPVPVEAFEIHRPPLK